MRIVAIETATPRYSVAFINDGTGEIVEETYEGGARLSQALWPLILRAERAAWPAATADLLVADAGPGSFTGVRMTLAVLKGLAFPRKIPLVTATSLEVLAVTSAENGGSGRVAAVIDARGGSWYYAVYEITPSATRVIVSPGIGAATEIRALRVQSYVGPSGWADTGLRWREVFPKASVLARIGLKKFREEGNAAATETRACYLKSGQI